MNQKDKPKMIRQRSTKKRMFYFKHVKTDAINGFDMVLFGKKVQLLLWEDPDKVIKHVREMQARYNTE